MHFYFSETFKQNLIESNHRKSSWSTSDIPETAFVEFAPWFKWTEVPPGAFSIFPSLMLMRQVQLQTSMS